jgi:hypothetical protein
MVGKMLHHLEQNAAGDIATTIIAAGIILAAVWRLYRIASHIEKIHEIVVKELVPNGGGALVDRVGRVERKLGIEKDAA